MSIENKKVMLTKVNLTFVTEKIKRLYICFIPINLHFGYFFFDLIDMKIVPFYFEVYGTPMIIISDDSPIII